MIVCYNHTHHLMLQECMCKHYTLCRQISIVHLVLCYLLTITSTSKHFFKISAQILKRKSWKKNYIEVCSEWVLSDRFRYAILKTHLMGNKINKSFLMEFHFIISDFLFGWFQWQSWYHDMSIISSAPGHTNYISSHV